MKTKTKKGLLVHEANPELVKKDFLDIMTSFRRQKPKRMTAEALLHEC